MTVEIRRRSSKQFVTVCYGNKIYIYEGVYNLAVSRNDKGQFVFSFVGKLANDNQNPDEEVRGVADIYREVLE